MSILICQPSGLNWPNGSVPRHMTPAMAGQEVKRTCRAVGSSSLPITNSSEWCSQPGSSHCRGGGWQSKYLNNLIEQDHRFIKRLVKLGMGFFSFETAWRTLQGYEAMNMLRKGQIHGVEKGHSMKQVTFLASLFGVAV